MLLLTAKLQPILYQNNNNCNLNLTMLNFKKEAANQQTKHNNNEQLRLIQKVTENHKDPQLVYYRPYQHTESQEDLYQLQGNEGKKISSKYKDNASKQEARHNIQLTIILVNQNDQILRKIEEIKKITAEEELKTNIFKNKVQENQKIIDELNAKKQKLKESTKIKTLNESYIPNKSVQLNTTANTNAWLNELFSKSQLQNLWNLKSKEKERNIIQSKIKSYTIDLSSFMNTARLKNQKAFDKNKTNDLKCQDERCKSKNLKSATNRTLTKTNKADLHEKQALLNKNIAQIRNLKKNKFNPQL